MSLKWYFAYGMIAAAIVLFWISKLTTYIPQ